MRAREHGRGYAPPVSRIRHHNIDNPGGGGNIKSIRASASEDPAEMRGPIFYIVRFHSSNSVLNES